MSSPWTSEDEDHSGPAPPKPSLAMSTPRDIPGEPAKGKRAKFNVGEDASTESQEAPAVHEEDQHDAEDSHAELKKAVHLALGKPRPILRRGDSTPGRHESPDHPEEIQDLDRKDMAARFAFERAQGVASAVASAPVSRSTSPHGHRKLLAVPGPSHSPPSERSSFYHVEDEILASGQTTPGGRDDYDHVPKPVKFRTGGLSGYLKMAQTRRRRGIFSHDVSENNSRRSSFESDHSSVPESGRSTPGGNTSPKRRFFHTSHSSASLAELVAHSSSIGGSIGGKEPVERALDEHRRRKRPPATSHNSFPGLKKLSHGRQKPRIGDEKIQLHIQGTISRQRYLIKLCRALMEYGAPPHRLEEYMRMSARALDIEAQFLYLPGTMLVSFDDSTTHTAEVKLVRTSPLGIDLGRLQDAHQVYKEVVHDIVGTDEATERLDAIMKRKDRWSKWVVVFAHGLGGVTVGPWAYDARPIDFGIIFILGCIVGLLRTVVAPRTDLYSSGTTLMAAMLSSFLARAFGSIAGGSIFCFSTLVQSSLTMMLPGYIVLCAALELQSGSFVAGSVRMVHAIIFSLFLGFGIELGVAVYGAIDPNASSAKTCQGANEYIVGHFLWGYVFVPLFSFSTILINQGKWTQMPLMIMIAEVGWIVSHFTAIRFPDPQISSMFSAIAISVIANLYSRFGWVFDVVVRYIAMKWIRPPGAKTPPQTPSLSTLESQPEKQSPKPTLFGQLRLRLYDNLMHASRDVRPKKLRELQKEADRADWEEHARDEKDPNQKAKPKFEPPTDIHISHSLAAAAMLPGIWVLVPSGLSVRGSLIQAIQSADKLVSQKNYSSTQNYTFSLGYVVVQVGIGLTVGLYIGSLVVYPFGKGGGTHQSKKKNLWTKRSGLFSF